MTCKIPPYFALESMIVLLEKQGVKDVDKTRIFQIAPNRVEYICNIGDPTLNTHPDLLASFDRKIYQKNYNDLLVKNIQDMNMDVLVWGSFSVIEVEDHTRGFYKSYYRIRADL